MLLWRMIKLIVSEIFKIRNCMQTVRIVYRANQLSLVSAITGQMVFIAKKQI